LTKYPESMLGVMFSEDYKFSLMLDRKGNIFIDRDGLRFELILEFLRDGVIPSDPEKLQNFEAESNYFNLPYEPMKAEIDEFSYESFHQNKDISLSETQQVLFDGIKRNMIRTKNDGELEAKISLTENRNSGKFVICKDIYGPVLNKLRSLGFKVSISDTLRSAFIKWE
ncbi:MAG: hypothetical protein ACRC2M_03190, partial [Planktothrix sp.]